MPLNVRLPKFEPFACTLLPLAVAVIFTVPLLWVKVPPVLRKDPPTASVAEGSVTVPAAMVTVFDVVALVSRKVHAPPDPLNVSI